MPMTCTFIAEDVSRLGGFCEVAMKMCVLLRTVGNDNVSFCDMEIELSYGKGHVPLFLSI